MLKLKTIKKKKIFSVLFIVFFIILLTVPLFGVKAQEKEIPINTPIPVLTKPCESLKSDGTLQYPDRYCVSDFGEYISDFYKWFARAVGIFAVVMLVYAGFQWIFASGNATKIEKAKATINGALIGLVLTLGATLLLQTINPDLISFKSMYLIDVGRKELITSLYCIDLQAVEGANITGVEICGTSYPITADVADAGSFTSNYCCGFSCLEDNKLCIYDSGTDGDCPFECLSADNACRNTSPGDCDETSDLMRKSGIIPYVCRETNEFWAQDLCIFTEKIYCPDGYEKISCLKGREICYENYISIIKDWLGDYWTGLSGIFAAYGSLGPILADRYDAYCTDDFNPGKLTDTICCGGTSKSMIDCTESSCSEYQVEVNCAEYDNQENICFKSHPLCGSGEDHTCPTMNPCNLEVQYTCPASARCCMEVFLEKGFET